MDTILAVDIEVDLDKKYGYGGSALRKDMH